MRLSFAIPATLVIALLALDRPASAQGYTDWKLAGKVDCTKHDDSSIRCLLSGENYPSGTLTITNSHASAVTFTWDEWHSACGFKGGLVQSKTAQIGAHETKVFSLLSPGNPITCREVFLHNCKAGAAELKCPQVLSGTGQMYTGNKQ